MKTVTEILRDYTDEFLTLEDANRELDQIGVGFQLDPARNQLTEEDKRATTVGYFANQVNGFGLLDTGTSTLDKVEIRNGKLVHKVCGNTFALCIVCGRIYQVNCDELIDC